MTKTCLYRGCKTSSHRDKEAVFVPFPKPHLDLKRTLEWIKFCGREDKDPAKVNKDTYVCLKHFPDDVEDLSWRRNKELRPYPISTEVENLIRIEETYSNNVQGMINLAGNSMKTYSRKRNREIKKESQDLTSSKRCVTYVNSSRTKRDKPRCDFKIRTEISKVLVETEKVFVKEEPPEDGYNYDPLNINVKQELPDV